MDYHDTQQNALAALEEIRRGSLPISDPLLCPKPRRIGVLSNMPKTKCEDSDTEAGEELLDIILKKENYGEQKHVNEVGSSPPFPFFFGSPPARAANPLIKNAQFAHEKYPFPISISAISSSSAAASASLSSPPSASCKGKCVRMKLAKLKPAAVRVEGFECHVPAVA